jgi:CRISPR system Cascade subunit CasD
VSTLLLTLAAPLQSWGAESRFTNRTTRHEPTKSAVLGLIAAAQGRRRADPVEDLLGLRFGVRIDQPGTLIRDFHTAHNGKGDSMPLSNRYYLADAVFVAGLEGDRGLLSGIADALTHPAFPLFLGRRSCSPSGKLVIGVTDGGLMEALRAEPWRASPWFRKRLPRGNIHLEVVRDRLPSDTGKETYETVRDIPESFSPVRREYTWRTVVHDDPVIVENTEGRVAPPSSHDPWAAL